MELGGLTLTASTKLHFLGFGERRRAADMRQTFYEDRTCRMQGQLPVGPAV